MTEPSCQHAKEDESKDPFAGSSSGEECDSSAQGHLRTLRWGAQALLSASRLEDRQQPLRQGPTYRWA